MIRGLYVLTLFLLTAGMCGGQEVTHTLTGGAFIKGDKMHKYVVVFTVSGNRVLGYSGTWLDGIGEFKTEISGTIDTINRVLHFTESKMTRSPLANACYFDVTLSWSLLAGNYIFTGTFVGRNDKDEYCDEGTVMQAVSKSSDPYFEKREPLHKDTTVKKKVTSNIARAEGAKKTNHEPSPVPAPEAEKEVIKITATTNQSLDWRSDSCVLEIWDGEFVDGDIVTILFNGQRVLESYSLVASKKRLVLPVRQGINKIAVVAESEGQAPPNTAQILLGDGDISYSILSCTHTGDTASMTLKRKKK